MPTCRICLQERTPAWMAFCTGRLSICRYCVKLLNRTDLSPRDAPAQWRADFLRYLRPGASTWDDGWFADRLEERLNDPEAVRRSVPLRVLRAHRAGLVCIDRKYLNYPARWAFKRYLVKHQDKYTCNVCGKLEGDDGRALHVHHIVHRSRSGTNAKTNLVTLCLECHQKQHPGIVIGAEGGEPRGTMPDVEVEPAHDAWDSGTEIQLGGITAAIHHIERGARTFSDYEKAMVDDLGEEVRPYLLSFYEGVRHSPGMHAEGMSSIEEVCRLREGDTADACQRAAHQDGVADAGKQESFLALSEPAATMPAASEPVAEPARDPPLVTVSPPAVCSPQPPDSANIRTHLFAFAIAAGFVLVALLLAMFSINRPPQEQPVVSAPQATAMPAATTPAPPTDEAQAARLVAWYAAEQAWRRQHAAFMADPERSAAMRQAIFDIDRETNHVLPAEDLLERAFARAAKETQR